MDVTVLLEARYVQTPDGAVWARGVFPYTFWTRYLDVFDRVRVVARVQPVAAAEDKWNRVDGEGVIVHPVPHYIGPGQYLRRRREVVGAIRGAYDPRSAVMLRVASQLGNCLFPLLRRRGHPYAVEVVGDPWDAFSPGAIEHPLRPAVRRWFAYQLRRQCRHAAAAAYVTERALQRRYPPNPEAVTTHYSSIELPPEALVDQPRQASRSPERRWRLIMVGTLDQLYKAPDLLIDAVAISARRGVNLELVLVGDGQCRPELEQRARDRGVGDRVIFRGRVPPNQGVRSELDAADLFVLPSRQEGLPRSIIEAMARALPCIGSDVGGIPELLAAEDIVPVNDVDALADRVAQVLGDPARLEAMSRRNVAKAGEYRDELLRQRRRMIYEALRDRTLAFIDQQPRRRLA